MRLQIVSTPGKGGNPISVVSEGLPEMSDLRLWYGISAHDSAMLVPFMCSCWSSSKLGDPALGLPQVWKLRAYSQESQCPFSTIASGTSVGMIHPASSHQHSPGTSDLCFSPCFIVTDSFWELLGQIKKYFPGAGKSDILQLPRIILGNCGSVLWYWFPFCPIYIQGSRWNMFCASWSLLKAESFLVMLVTRPIWWQQNSFSNLWSARNLQVASCF